LAIDLANICDHIAECKPALLILPHLPMIASTVDCVPESCMDKLPRERR
jgi:hypothetical protein